MNDLDLKVSGLSVRYRQAIAVEGASFHIPTGAVTALLGPNGAGKSSMFNSIAGVVASSGRISFGERDITALRSTERARAGLVLVPQGRQIFPHLTVRENLQVVADALGLASGVVHEALERFPILSQRHRSLAGVLSGGEQQMLALARGLMSKPRILLLDEPTLGLAPSIVRGLLRTVGELVSDGVGIVIAEPSVGLINEYIDRGYIILRGHVVGSAETGAGLENEYRRQLGLGSQGKAAPLPSP